MKSIYFLLILLSLPNFSFGQKYSVTVDSLTRAYIGQLPKRQQAKFQKILEKRAEWNVLERADTMSFDYVFIEESYCSRDASNIVIERYFLSSDTIPKVVYENGKCVNIEMLYRKWYARNGRDHTSPAYYSLFPMIAGFSKNKTVQKLVYCKNQILLTGCVKRSNEKRYFRVRKTRQLKSTWQVQIMIDKGEKVILVSVQVKAVCPSFKISLEDSGVWSF